MKQDEAFNPAGMSRFRSGCFTAALKLLREPDPATVSEQEPQPEQGEEEGTMPKFRFQSLQVPILPPDLTYQALAPSVNWLSDLAGIIGTGVRYHKLAQSPNCSWTA